MSRGGQQGKVPATAQDLFQAAKSVRERAYSPYSGCKVGAAVRTLDGRIFAGCNVENSSYGATVCAERVAIGSAVSEGELRIAEIMVVTDASPAWPPCGMCRQVIAEFAGNPPVHLANLKGECRTVPFEELLPDAFRPSHLEPPKR